MDDAITLDDYSLLKSLIGQKASPEELESLLFKSCDYLAENCAAVLLTMGVDKDCMDRNRMTPLMHAVLAGCVEITDLLITWSAQVNTLGGSEGNSALHLAAHMGHLEISKILIASEANVNIRNEKDDTPLIIAAGEGHLDIVKLLLENHASVNRRGHRECSALHRATEGGFYEVCSYLIASKAGLEDEDTFGNTPLICASENGHTNLVLLYLAQGADVNRVTHSGTTALHYAAKEGWTACCKVLLHHGAEIDAQDIRRFTPLMLAVLERHKKVMQLMLDARCNVNMVAYNRRTALHYAAERNYVDCCKILMDSGAYMETLDGDRCSPVMLAAMKGNLETLRLLISCGADLTHVTRQGLSILHLAAESGDIECCKLLMHCGLSMDIRNSEGITPLICAVRSVKTPVIMYFLSQGCSVEKFPGDAFTALTEAVYRNVDKFVIEKMLVQGASPNETDHFNTLPLWYAVDNLNLPVVKLLLMCNCDFLSETESVFAPCILCSPIAHAVHKASPVMVQWLVSAYAEEGASVLRRMKPCNVFSNPENSDFAVMILQLVSQPQSLLRQCRRTIRKQLGHGFRVASKISCLHLPNLLYNYMLFSDLDLSQLSVKY